MMVTVATVTRGLVYFTRGYLEDGINMETKVNLALLWMNVKDVLKRREKRAPEGVIPSRMDGSWPAPCVVRRSPNTATHTHLP